MNIPVYVMQALNLLEEHGFQAYLVGGCVRDSLLSLEPHDYDLTTDATPDKIKEVFKDYDTVLTGEAFGTITVVIDKHLIEITTFRADGNYDDHRHPTEVKFSKTLKEDLIRRDFSINAMALDKSGKLYDYSNGYEDLQNKVIRCVGDPNTRFKEDPLRILRAFRFAARFKFLIDAEVLKAVRKNSYLIKHVSNERIREELEKIIIHEPAMIETMHENVILKYILPEVDSLFYIEQRNPWHYTDVGHHTMDALKYIEKFNLNDYEKKIVGLVLLFHDTGKIRTKTIDDDGIYHFKGHPEESYNITKDIVSRFKFLLNESELILKLVRYHDENWLPKRRSLLTIVDTLNFSYDEFRLLGYIKEADLSAHNITKEDNRVSNYLKLLKMYEQKLKDDKIFKESDLAITGDDIMKLLHIPPGQLVGEIKRDLFELVFLNPSMNDKETLLEYLRSIYEQ